jgi:hypothetical protein
MKRSLIIVVSLIFICSVNELNAQTIDSTAQQESVLPPTSKSKNAKSATKYSTPPVSKSDWKKKIYVGGYFGMSFGSYTNIEVSPIVGYNFTKDFNMGIGVIYNYYAYDVPNYTGFGTTRVSSSNWGGRLNASYTLFNLVSLGAEYQLLSVDVYGYDDLGSLNSRKELINILFLGGGIRQKIGRNASMFIMAYYDVLQNKYSPYNDQVVWRIGVAAGF